ncbi:hypothetical protein ACFLZX_01060 [Nanoarchaeota archaeon]
MQDTIGVEQYNSPSDRYSSNRQDITKILRTFGNNSLEEKIDIIEGVNFIDDSDPEDPWAFLDPNAELNTMPLFEQYLQEEIGISLRGGEDYLSEEDEEKYTPNYEFAIYELPTEEELEYSFSEEENYELAEAEEEEEIITVSEDNIEELVEECEED